MEFQALMDLANRMCNSCHFCTGCALDKLKGKYPEYTDCRIVMCEHPDEAEEEIVKWIDEHRKETYIDKLKKILPDSNIDRLRIDLCPGDFFKNGPIANGCFMNNEICANCWNSEVKDDG